MGNKGNSEVLPGENQWEEFWERYRKHIEDISVDNNKDYLIKDGVKDYESYKSKSLQIVYVLKESNESNVKEEDKIEKNLLDNGQWISQYIAGEINSRMLTMISKIDELIQETHDLPLKLDISEIIEKIKDQTIEHSLFKSIPLINISKRGNGGTSTLDRRLNNAIEKDGQLLLEEIRLLEPNIVIVGAKGKLNSLLTKGFALKENEYAKHSIEYVANSKQSTNESTLTYYIAKIKIGGKPILFIETDHFSYSKRSFYYAIAAVLLDKKIVENMNK